MNNGRARESNQQPVSQVHVLRGLSANNKLNITQTFDRFLRVQKALQGKAKMMVTNSFLLSHICFQKAFSSGLLKPGTVCSRVNPFPNKPWFLHVCSTGLLKTLWEKEKLLVTSNFSFTVWRTFCHFNPI